jgi:hypothetical protein
MADDRMIDFFAGLPTNQAPFALDISNNFHNDNDSGDNDGDGDGDDDGISKAPPPPPDVLQVLQLCLICNVADTWMVDRGYQEFLNNDFDINEGASWSDCGEPGEMPTLPPDVWV